MRKFRSTLPTKYSPISSKASPGLVSLPPNLFNPDIIGDKFANTCIAMDISLRGHTYKAEHLTDINYLPLGNLFIEEDGTFTLENTTNYESLSPQQKTKLTQPVMKKLCNPEVKAAIAQTISAIFPRIPKDLVNYEGMGQFSLNITLKELLAIAIQCGTELQSSAEVSQGDGRIKELEAEIARLKATSN